MAFEEVPLMSAPPPRDDRLPSRIGRYVVLEIVGIGGMGVVATAYDPKLDRKIALKLVRRRDHDDARRVSIGQARLQREARALAKLKHPNVVAVHDVDVVDGRLYIAMEYVEGEPIADWMEREARPWRQVVEVFIQAARGLEAAHAAGIVHRDFKPANVLLEPTGRVVVLDFGLALAQQEMLNAADESAEIETPEPDAETEGFDRTERDGIDSETHRRLTAVGRRVGTPAYMAPEQILGQTVGPGADQFAFGVSLFEALYGVLPFQGTPQDAMWNAIEGVVTAPAKLRGVPPWLHRVVLRTLGRDPASRLPDMAAVIAELSRGLGRRRSARIAAAAGAGVLVLGSAAAVWAAREACPGASQRVDALWNETRRDALRSDFAATGTPFAGDAAHASITALDATAEAWKATHVGICEATRVRGEQSDALLDHRMACLDGALLELGALVDLFAQPDDALVEHAADAADRLAKPQSCLEARPEEGESPPPAGERPQVDEAREHIAKAVVLINAGRGKDALVPARQAWAIVEPLTHAPSRVEARRMVAEALRGSGEREAAEAESAAGIRDAAAHRLLLAEARLWITRLNILAIDLRQHDRAIAESLAVEAAVSRAASDPLLRPQLEQTLGAALLGKGDLAGATAHLERAATEFAALEHPGFLARAMNDLGTALSQGGRHADAIAAYRAAYDSSRERVGASHPVTATFALNLGSALMHADDPASRAEAGELFAAARTVREAVFGPNDTEVAEVLLSEGALARRSGDPERAAATLRRAIEIFGGRASSDVRAGMALNTLALLERGVGRLDAAEAALTDALAVFERAGVTNHPSRLRAVIRRGDLRLTRGDRAGALADHDTAAALVKTTPGARPDDHAELAKLASGLALPAAPK